MLRQIDDSPERQQKALPQKRRFLKKKVNLVEVSWTYSSANKPT
jgi:hypothetical protein